MDAISQLRTSLLNALSGRGAQNGEQELFDALMLHKSRLASIFDVGNRNPQEQKEIESGKTVLNGKQVAVNTEFAGQVIFLSQVLECSERYVASLLHSIMSQNPNLTPISCLELVVAEFHTRRRHLVDCVRYLLEATEAAETADVPQLYHHINNYVRRDLAIPQSSPAGEIPLAYRIFKEMENLGNVIVRADNARKSAQSNTVIPPQGNPTLGFDISNARYESLKYERRYLANCLYLLARLGLVSPNEIKAMVEWLVTNPNHSMTFYVLTTVLTVFNVVDPDSPGARSRSVLANDKALVSFMTKKLEAASDWKEPGLKATVLLKWTLFLTEHRHRNPTLENREGFRTEELEVQIWNAVQGDIFLYLSMALLQLRKSTGFSPSLLSGLTLSSEQQEQREVPPDDFGVYILNAFEALIRSLIIHASSELRKIKQRQEDLVLANVRTNRARSNTSRFHPAPATETEKRSSPRNDIAMLYSFIGLLYSTLPAESALQFWGSGSQVEPNRTNYLEFLETSAGRLPAFLQWAVWSTQAQDANMNMALYDMLAGLSKGQQCSELSYNFMARGGGEIIPGSSIPSGGSSVSWDIIFGLLDSWATGPSARSPMVPQVNNQSMLGGSSTFTPAANRAQEMHLGPQDVLLAQSFLHLLSTVVIHSVAVRVTISGHARFRAIPTLVSLIPLRVPLELKGMIFETLAAFCQPGAGIPGVEICRAVWTLMERLEVINVRPSAAVGFSGTFISVKGVEVELEEIEAIHGLYPATIPFLKLLSTLIHTPKRIPLKDRVSDQASINTIPESLGQPYRLPGIGPFVNFVIDNVFSKISTREYRRPSERWQLNDLCLAFIERVLASYDMESLLASAEAGSLKGNSIDPYLVHPGYEVMKRLLTTSTLQNSILSYVVEGLIGFEKGFAEEEPFFESTITRVLRIVHRVLEIQDIFLDVLIPLISEFDSAPFIGTVHSRSHFVKFDQTLSFGPHYVPAIAAYVAYPSHSEVVLLSVKIIDILSSSSALSNLAALIERSDDSDRILGGYLQILSVESSEDISMAETTAEQITGAGAPDTEDVPVSLEQATRTAVLDMLIHNTATNRPSPNVAHYLLFGRTNLEAGIQDPHALGARNACIHIILQLLNIGIPTLKGKGKRSEVHTSPLFLTLPALAERCYHVIYQLCVHPRTSSSTMRYLRTREDFFTRHLSAIPSQVPQMFQEPTIEVLYNDGSRVITTVPTLSSFLRLRSWIFDLVALDLHILTSKGRSRNVSEVLDILFSNETTLDESTSWEDEVFKPFREVGQSHLKVIEFVQSLTFEWADSLTVKPVDLQLLADVNLQTCMRKDGADCEIIDRSALLVLLTTARRALFAQNKIVTPIQAQQLETEISYILESCAIENHRRQVVHAVGKGFEAWRRILDVTLTKCFDSLPQDHRENMLFDILHVLPPIIKSEDIHESTAVLLSEVVLSSITKLCEDRRHQVILQSAGGDPHSELLPAERLYLILRSILECIVGSSHMELVRGNLYAALINYVNLVSSPEDTSTKTQALTVSMFGSTREASPFSDSLSVVPSPSQSSQLQIHSLALLKTGLERLLVTVSRDAIDGSEVWRTVAFMLLDSLVQLSALEKQHPVLTPLVRHGILSNFVQSIKESDPLLQTVLKPDPDDLNPLYVYESKMSFFIRMAQTRTGAERLLDVQLIPILAQCDFLDARPEADASFVDHDSFLPSAIQRYHNLFMPSLQLLNAMLASLGGTHATASNQVLDFLSRHSATIVILLKNETGDLSLSLLEEIHLLVTLCAQVLPLVPHSELASVHSGFGAINAAVLGLSTKCLGRGTWTEALRPQTDGEIFRASVLASGFGSNTKFDVEVRKNERLLRKALVAYTGATSDFTEPEINLVLSPVHVASRYNERSSHFLATIPTIGDALEALNSLCQDLSNTLKQISDISAELDAKELIAVNNIQDIVGDIDIDFIQDLEIGQKRNLICRELERISAEARRDVKMTINTLEMLLLLLWRHFMYYAEGTQAKAPQLNASTATAMRFLSTPDPQAFRLEVGKQLVPALQRLQTLMADETLTEEEWRASQAYVEIMCRRLRDTAGIQPDTDETMEAMHS